MPVFRGIARRPSRAGQDLAPAVLPCQTQQNFLLGLQVDRFARASSDPLGLLPKAGCDTLDVTRSLLEPTELEQVRMSPDRDRSTNGSAVLKVS